MSSAIGSRGSQPRTGTRADTCAMESGSRNPAIFVLVPGFWLGGWAWEGVETVTATR
jgi:hypothetical protein